MIAVYRFLFGVIMLHLNDKASIIKSIEYWAYGSFITSVGLGLLAFFPYPASFEVDLLFSILTNVALVSGDSIFLMGFIILKKKPVKKWILYGIPLLTLGNVLFFSIIIRDLPLRLTINSLIMASLYFISAVELYKSPLKSLNTVFKQSSFICVFYGFSTLVRAVVIIKFSGYFSPGYNSLILTILTSIGSILLIILMFNTVIIINKVLNEELAQQIEGKNKLYAIIWHDLRGQVNNFLNFNLILEDSISVWNEAKTKEWISTMSEIAVSTTVLLENLLQWSKSQLKDIRPEVKPNDISLLTNHAINLLQPQAEAKEIKIFFDRKEKIIGSFDYNMIFLVVRNLLSNAIKFTHTNGSITIAISEFNRMIHFIISDSGVGIEADDLKLIFQKESFISNKGTNGEQGNGFGLTICKEFIEHHSGKIYAKSTIGKGSEFGFTLPKKDHYR